ncbi:MAG TPA: SPOR domain-containing protein [Paenalcaligenes sp.]|nr:SPOR domain-containing protein [Paenalcaligenes sp.]
MARKRKRSSKSRGGTFTGIIIGLVLGLAAAVAVAIYVTKAPMPFYDRASREPNEIILPDVHDAPDPNSKLYQKNSRLPEDTRIPTPTKKQQEDELGQFIAGLNQLEPVPEGSLPKSPPPESEQARPDTSESATGDAPATTESAATPGKETTYFLQAGAFRSAQDADTVKARIIMLGHDANVQVAQLDGSPINRVRVGPFKGIDELNKAREALGAEQIETSVVRQ